ncbi:MAG: hypothetical protein P9X26_04340 [Candidatus Stygibacter frigidus]|nr:hypothetical protein [Candidatus Stygibacter frigidus]
MMGSHLIEHLYPEEAWELLNQMNRILKPGDIICLRAPLMSRHFYNDLTHIRPYPPQSILEYLGGNWQEDHPQTYQVLKGEYKVLKIKWRRLPLLSGIIHNAFLIRVLEVFARLGFRSFNRSGYLMILQKK